MLARVDVTLSRVVTLSAAASLAALLGCHKPATTQPEPGAEAGSGSTSAPRDPYDAAFTDPLGIGEWRCRARDDSAALTGWGYSGGPEPGPEMIVTTWTLWIEREAVATRQETMGGTSTGEPLRRQIAPAQDSSVPEAMTPSAWTEKLIIDREDGEPLFGDTLELRVTFDCERDDSPPMP